ncbi:MAG: hypothetical protein ABIT83_23125 [Massilia sp.]
MFADAILIHAPSGLFTELSLVLIARAIALNLLGVALLMLFRPLLTGVGRALLLVIQPRLSREQRLARRHRRDAELVQAMINASPGPDDASELRAIAARA